MSSFAAVVRNFIFSFPH